MPYRVVAAEALAAWRVADKCLAECEPDSPEWHAAFIDAELAKQRYQDAVDAAHAAHLPEPPPFDQASRRSDDATSAGPAESLD